MIEHSAGWESNNIGIYPGFVLDTLSHFGQIHNVGVRLRRSSSSSPKGKLLQPSEFQNAGFGILRIDDFFLFKIYGQVDTGKIRIWGL